MHGKAKKNILTIHDNLLCAVVSIIVGVCGVCVWTYLKKEAIVPGAYPTGLLNTDSFADAAINGIEDKTKKRNRGHNKKEK